MNKQMSDKTINRLTLYHYILNDYILNGIECISSSQIAGMLKIDNSQVRRDISGLKNIQKTHLGYLVKSVQKSIEEELGFANQKEIFIIGAGNLGFALAKYNDFADYGLNVTALFDTDEAKIGQEINGKKIFNISDLPKIISETEVDIAILTIPTCFAQETADFLVKSGIKYIWNFAPVVLNVPDYVQVFNENLMGNFVRFTYQKIN